MNSLLERLTGTAVRIVGYLRSWGGKRVSRPLVVLLVLIFGYIAFTLYTVYQVKVFRRHPQRDTAMHLLRGEWPHDVIARALAFKHGSPGYKQDLRSWIYRNNQMADTPWNAWILQGDVETMSDEELQRNLPNYPLSLRSALVPYVRKTLELGGPKAPMVLPLLIRDGSEQGRELYRSWVESKLVNGRDTIAFEYAAQYLVQSPIVPPVGLFDLIWPHLSAKQRTHVLYHLAKSLKPDNPHCSEMFDWLWRGLEDGRITMSPVVARLAGRFLSFANQRADTIGLIVRHVQQIDAGHVSELLHHYREPVRLNEGELDPDASEAELKLLEEKLAELQKNSDLELVSVATELFDRVKDLRPQVATALLAAIAGSDIVAAEELAMPVLVGPDRELKKSAIVTLINYESSIAVGHIDEAFTGAAPRRTMFDYIGSYTQGSKAAERYKALAKHDYQETGKTWPPAYMSGPPVRDDIAGWKAFISAYPWFPGTDDAYYRLAYTQYIFGDVQGALDTVHQFLERKEWADRDAAPYVICLLRIIAGAAVVSAQTRETDDFIHHLQTLLANPLGVVIFDPAPRMEPILDAIDWFISHPEFVQTLNTDQKTLTMMRQIAAVVQSHHTHNRIAYVGQLLLRSVDSNNKASPDERVSSAEEASSDDEDVDSTHQVEQEEREDYPEDGEDPDYYLLIEDETATDSEADDYYDPRPWLRAILYANFFQPTEPSGEEQFKQLEPVDPTVVAISRAASLMETRLASLDLTNVMDEETSASMGIVLWVVLHADAEFNEEHSPLARCFSAVASVDNQRIPERFRQRFEELTSMIRREEQ